MRYLLTFVLMFTVSAAYAERITIYAAASTTNAINEIISAYEAEGGDDVIASFASSGTLAKQINNNAPASIFLSANNKWMNWLNDKGKVRKDSITPLLANRLALIAPTSSDVQPQKLDKATATKLLNKKTRIAMSDPAHSPAGIYAQKTLETLGIWKNIERQAVRMQTVRIALAMVERNAVPFGIVYSSDAVLSNKVKTIGLFDENLHGAIRYPMALIKGKESVKAKAFYKFLKSTKAAKIFAKYGFVAVK